MATPINEILNIARRYTGSALTGPLAAHRSRVPQLSLEPTDDTAEAVHLLATLERMLTKKPKGYSESTNIGAPNQPLDASAVAAFANVLTAAYTLSQCAETWPKRYDTSWLTEVLDHKFKLDHVDLMLTYVRERTAVLRGAMKSKAAPFDIAEVDFTLKILAKANATPGTLMLVVEAVDQASPPRYEQKMFDAVLPRFGEELSVAEAVTAMNQVVVEFEKALLLVTTQARDGQLFTQPVVDPEFARASRVAFQALRGLPAADRALLAKHPTAITNVL